MSMSVIAPSALSVVRIPVHELLSTEALKGITDAANSIDAARNYEGEYFNMSVASKVILGEVLPDAIVLVPMFNMTDEEPMDSTNLAAGHMMYLRLTGPPQTRMVFAKCIAYSDGAVQTGPSVGGLVRFPPPTHLLIGKGVLIEAINSLELSTNDIISVDDEGSRKRLCIRPPESYGGLAKVNSDKGMSEKYIIDLDSGIHYTRSKSDLIQREKDLRFAFRAIGRDRWKFVMGSDLLLQPEEYRIMIKQQGRLRSDRRHTAFKSCGHYDKVQNLEFLHITSQLKLLITGQLFVEGDAPTLRLQDFVGGEPFGMINRICPNQNRRMIQVLKNLQSCLQIYLDDTFGTCFDRFIEDLEGPVRPMQLVHEDFLLYSVEEKLQKFFWIVSSERAGFPQLSPVEMSVKNPEECAACLTAFFGQLSSDLSDHQTRTLEEEYYRMRIAQEKELTVKLKKETPPLKKAVGAGKEVTSTLTRACAGFLGNQLKAKHADGTAYSCSYNPCRFLHIGRKGKPFKDVAKLVAEMPSPAREDLTKAMKKKA